MTNFNVTINSKKCQGFGACAKTAPEAFRLNAANKAEVIDPQAASDESLRAAAQNCPYRAITLSDAASGAQVFPPVRK